MLIRHGSNLYLYGGGTLVKLALAGPHLPAAVISVDDTTWTNLVTAFGPVIGA
jgi:hypothetical protein